MVDGISTAQSLPSLSQEWTILIPQLGFGGVIFTAFMFLLKWVLKTQEKILDNSKEERVGTHLVQQGFLKTLEQLNIQSCEFHKQVQDSHSFQRSEHDKMLDGLNNICIVTKQHAECLDKIQRNLDEQGRVLVRINGYKHE